MFCVSINVIDETLKVKTSDASSRREISRNLRVSSLGLWRLFGAFLRFEHDGNDDVTVKMA